MTTCLAAGTAVVWTRQRSLQTRTRSEPFMIERTDGTQVTCVTLECNRLAPVSELVIQGSADDSQACVPAAGATGLGTTGRRASVRPKTPRHDGTAGEHRGRAAEVPARPIPRAPQLLRDEVPRHVATGRTPADSGCEILAVDFLNLLVRAFHAGKPSDTHAIVSMGRTLASAMQRLRPRVIVFAMDGGHKHRTALLPAYKAHRPPSDPLLVRQRELAEQALSAIGFPMVRVVDFEADDVLASIAQRHRDVVICSSDKDLLSLTGRARVYHPWSAGGFVTSEEKLALPAHQVSDYLALCGDSSDGVPGVRGIGPKKALALLQEFESLEAILAAALLGRIPGAVGKALVEHRNAALQCQQVTELVRTLPLPELRSWCPPVGWQCTLQQMGLVHLATALSSVAREYPMPDDRAGSASTAKDEPGRLTVDRETRARPENAESSAPRAELVRQWGMGRRCGEQSERRREPIDNPWKRDSEYFAAWQAGFEDRPLITQAPFARPRQISLFD